MNTDQIQAQEKWKTRAYTGVALVAACALIWVALNVMGILWQAVATIITTAVIAFMLHGLVNYLERHGLPRTIAALIAILVLFAILFAFFAAFVPPIAEQVTSFSAALPEYIRQVRDALNQYQNIIPAENSFLNELSASLSTWVQEQSGLLIQNAAGGIFKSVFNVGNAVVIFFISVICAFWILADLPTISRELLSLFNSEQQKTVHVVTGAFGNAVYGWARATLTCAVIVGILNGLVFWILGIPYFALLGLLCGILYFIPYIGAIITGIIVLLAGLLVSPFVAILALLINTVVHNVVANLISPKLMESSVSVHPAIILVAILVGGALGGIVGMLFSIPIAAAIQGVFVTFFEERTGKQLATEEGALFQKPKVKVKPTFRRPVKKKD